MLAAAVLPSLLVSPFMHTMKLTTERIGIPLPLLAAAGFLSSAGARVIDALLSAIARDFHVGVPQVAVVLAAFTLPYGLCQLVVGPLADRFGKPRVLVCALLGYAAATAGCAMASGLLSLTLLRVLSGAASAGLVPVCLAYIGDGTNYADRQIVLSRFLTGVVMAQVIAGPFGGVIGQWLSWRGAFMVLSAGALTLAVTLAIHLRRIRFAPPAAPAPRSFAGLWQRGPALLLALTVADGMMFTGTVPFIGPFLQQRMRLSYSAAGLVLACFGLGCCGYITLASRLVPRWPESRLVLVGGLVAALGMGLAATARAWPACLVAEIALGLGYFTLHTVLQTRATEMLPSARGVAVSSFAFALFSGQALGALLCGAGIGWWGYRAVFAADCPALALLGLTLWFGLRSGAGGWGRWVDHKAQQA